MVRRETLFISIVLLLLFASIFVSKYWHIFAYKKNLFSLALYSFDKKADKRVCFGLLVQARSQQERYAELRIYLDGKEILKDRFKVKPEDRRNYCIEVSELQEGKHKVEILSGELKLFFNFEKVSKLEKEEIPKVKIVGIKDRSLKFQVSNFPKNKFLPVEIWVNNKLDHVVYPEKEKQLFIERIELNEGVNEVIVKVPGSEDRITKTYVKLNGGTIGLLILVLGVMAFSLYTLFSKYDFYLKATLAFAFFLGLLALIGFVLGLFKLFTYQNILFTYAIIFLAFFACSLRKGKFKEGRISIRKWLSEIRIEELTLIFFFGFVVIFFGLFIPSHETYFNIFYERGTKEVLANHGMPEVDELSYLGRAFTFIPGYFYIEGSLSLLAGLEGLQLLALMCCTGALFMLLASLLLANTLGLKRSLLFFPLVLSTSTFVFSTITLTPRHCIALAFLLTALALALKRMRYKAMFALAIGLFIQIPLLIFFLILFPILAKLKNPKSSLTEIAKETAIVTFGSVMLFCPLYAPIFLRAGFPYQILSQQWGYLIGMGPLVLLADPGILFFLFLFFLIFESKLILQNRAVINREKKLLFCSIVAVLLLQSFLSSRLSLISAVLLALFICYSLESYKKEVSELFSLMFSFVLFIGLYLAITLSYGYTVAPEVDSAIEFLKQYSSSSENVLADPYFGHLIAYKAERKTLADLMVEYADEKKIEDAYRFLKGKDYSILERYNISLVFNERFLINEKVIDNKPLAEELEFEELAKIFVNDKIAIHRVIRNS